MAKPYSEILREIDKLPKMDDEPMALSDVPADALGDQTTPEDQYSDNEAYEQQEPDQEA